MDSPMSTSTEISETTSTCSPIHTSTSATSSNNGAIQKRIRMCQQNAAAATTTNQNASVSSPYKSNLTLNIRPTWSTTTTSAVPKLQLLQCPMCDHGCEDPKKLEEHVNRVHFDPQSPARVDEGGRGGSGSMAASSRGLRTPSTLPCPLCTAHYPTSLELERHVNTDHR